MPYKDPSLWDALLMWLSVNSPVLYAVFLSASIAVTRVIYGGGSGRQMLLEATICGLITVAIAPLVEWLGIPATMSQFVGGAVGLIGVEQLRALAIGIGRKKAGLDEDKHE